MNSRLLMTLHLIVEAAQKIGTGAIGADGPVHVVEEIL